MHIDLGASIVSMVVSAIASAVIVVTVLKTKMSVIERVLEEHSKKINHLELGMTTIQETLNRSFTDTLQTVNAHETRIRTLEIGNSSVDVKFDSIITQLKRIEKSYENLSNKIDGHINKG